MHARVTQISVLPGKLGEFTEAVNSMLPAAQQQAGFRGLLVLRGDQPASHDAQVISLWDSLEALRHSEKNLYFYQAISRVLSCSHGFPAIREQQVLLIDFVQG